MVYHLSQKLTVLGYASYILCHCVHYIYKELKNAVCLFSQEELHKKATGKG